jgi:hypothetical protein
MFSRVKALLMRRKVLKDDKEWMNSILRERNLMDFPLAGQKEMSIILEASRLISITTFAILRDKYKNNIERTLARQIKHDSAQALLTKVLASQVTNFLTGQSVDEAYNNAKEPLKSVIGLIKDVVPKQAIIELNNNKELRNIIVRNLYFIQHMDWAFKETKPYLSSSQKAQVEYLLNNCGEGVPYDLNPDAFLILVKDFWIKYRSTID